MDKGSGRHNGGGEDAQGLLTVEEVAAYLRCHPSTVYRLTYRGELRRTKILGMVRFARKQLDQFITDHTL